MEISISGNGVMPRLGVSSLRKQILLFQGKSAHTIYTRINMSQNCEGNCGLWVLNEILKKTYPENLKKIVGAVWELSAK